MKITEEHIGAVLLVKKTEMDSEGKERLTGELQELIVTALDPDGTYFKYYDNLRSNTRSEAVGWIETNFEEIYDLKIVKLMSWNHIDEQYSKFTRPPKFEAMDNRELSEESGS